MIEQELIQELQKHDKKEALDIMLRNLNERRCTYDEFLELLQKTGLEVPEDIENAIISRFYKSKDVRQDLIIRDLNKMDFVETRNFYDQQIKNGIKKEDLLNEIYNLWEEGRISGFDYRYFYSVIEEPLLEKFITEANRVGRYQY